MSRSIGSLRVTLRTLARVPLFSAATVLTLALGIGATTAIYSVVEATMLRPLPYPAPDELLQPQLTVQEQGDAEPRAVVWSYPKFETFRRAQQSFAQVAVYASHTVTITGGSAPERLRSELVSGTYFDLLGGRAAAGRVLQASDDADGDQDVVVLSHAFWMRRFGGDSAVVGQRVVLSGQPVTVAGVAEPSFRALSGETDIWLPMAMAPRLLYGSILEQRWSHWMDAVGRLRAGVTVAQAREEMARLGREVDEAHVPPNPRGRSWGASAVRLAEARDEPTLRRAILVLFGAVGCVLLIACVNVANLLLVRVAGREREFAIRLAVGAGRGRVVRENLGESLLLSAAGGAVGVLLAFWLLDGIRALDLTLLGGLPTQATQFLDLASVRVSTGVLGFAVLLSLLTGLLCGLFPALHASRTGITGSLKVGAAQASEGGLSLRRGRARALLVAGDIALSLVLAVAAGLLLRSFAAARGADTGFAPKGVLTFRVQPPDDPAFTGANALAYKRRLMAELARLPGVRSVGHNTCAPLSRACNGTSVMAIEGRADYSPGAEPEIGVHTANAAYLEAIGARVVRGRFLTDRDVQGSPKVLVINEVAARQLFPNEDPVGRRMSIGIGLLDWEQREMAEIVGVVNDVNYDGVGTPIGPAVYVSYLQDVGRGGMYFVRTALSAEQMVAGMRRAVPAVSTDLVPYDVLTLEQRVSRALSQIRFGSVLLGAFAGLAVLLTVVGVYGVFTYSVAQRSRELGIRMALGARPSAVTGLVLRQALALAAAGIAAGVAVAWATTRLLQGLLYGVEPGDPATFTLTALLSAVIAAGASYLPARRAARTDPAIALRTD